MFRIFTVTAALALSTGCVGIPAALLLADALDRDDDYGYDDYDYVDTGYGADDYASDWVDVAGQMRGELPSTGAFDRDITRGSVWTTDRTVDFDVEAADGSWAMLAGGFDTDYLQDGITTALAPADHWVYGCSGPQSTSTLFDQSAEAVRVRRDRIVIDGEPMIELTIVADFGVDGEVTAVVVQPEPQPGGSD